MFAHHGGATGERKVEAAANGAQHFAMLPPQRGSVPVVVALVHHRMECRVQFTVPLRIGKIIFLDEVLEAFQFSNVLFGRHADKPARQSRLDQDSDLGNVTDEIMINWPDPRSAIEGEDDEAFTPEDLKRLANWVRRGAVTAGKIGCNEALVGLQTAVDNSVTNELVDGGTFAGGADRIDRHGRSRLEISCLVHARLPSTP